MRIGIDCRLWNETGIGRYIRNIVHGIAQLDTTNEYILFVLPKDSHKINLPTNFKKVEVNIRWYTFIEQFILPIFLYREHLDLLFVPNLNVPILYFKKFVVTVHDLTVLKIKTGRASTHSYLFYLAKRLAVNITLFYAVKFSKKIFTVSQYVKNDIKKHYNISDKKILITPNAVSKKFHVEPEGTVSSVLTKYKVTRPYIFYVGNAHPHKNLNKLVDAFEIVASEFKDLTLVLGGSKRFFYERMQKEIAQRKISRKIIFTGFIDDCDLPAFYTGAEAFVTPSLHEGFGIQILESFACGTKVVCSKRTSLPEIGGNIAYYFNPQDINDIAHSILLCLKDTDEKRIKAGFLRIKDFSWDASSQTIYETCISL